VLLQFIAFIGGDTVRVAYDLLANADIPDVVQYSAEHQYLHLVIVKPEVSPEYRSIAGNSLGVAARIMVFGLDSAYQ